MPRRDNDEHVSVQDVLCKHMTDKALLCVIHDEEMWIPLSQVHDDSEVFNDTSACEGTLIITKWIAEQKNLAEEADDFNDYS